MMVRDIADYIESRGVLGTNPADKFALSYSNMPDAPDNHITVYQYGGSPGEEVHNKVGIAYEHPGLQVRTRAKSYDDAEAKAYAIYSTLQLTSIKLGDRYYQRIMPTTSPFLLERDAKERAVFVTNFSVMCEA